MKLFPNDKSQLNIFASVVLISILTSTIFGFLAGMIGGRAAGRLLEGDEKGERARSFIERFLPLPDEKSSQGESAEEGKDTPYEAKVSSEQAVIEVAKKAAPAVVSVIVTKDVPLVEQFYIDPFEGFRDPFFPNDFFSPFKIPQYREKGTEKREIGGGTGFIISQDGLILTNKHVVVDTEAEYTVLTNDGEKYSAKVLARDPVQDIAVLKVEKANLPVLKLGNSDTIEIGQTVVAIGNALGEFRNTVSVGVISGLRRTITASGGGTSETLDEVIQTDAAINRGNSGGPLLNLRGDVIGINTAVAIGAENIGFAIPVNKAKRDIEQVKSQGKITYPFLGVRYILINKQIQDANKLPVDYGALVVRGENPEELAVVPGSAADKAGIVENDIILELGGVKVNQENTLAKLIQRHRVGDSLILKLLSKGTERTVTVLLGETE